MDGEDDDGRSDGLGIIIWLCIVMLLARLGFMVHEAICDARWGANRVPGPRCEPCALDVGDVGDVGDGRELVAALEASLLDAGRASKKGL